MKKIQKITIRISFCLFLLLVVGFSISCKKKPTHTHEWKEATCTEPKTCSLCHETEGVALGHVLGNWNPQTYPTCESYGFNVEVCPRCNEKLSIIKIDAWGHNLVHYESLEPTCTEAGHTAYDACTRCDYTTYIELPSEHIWTEATYDYPKTCTRCGITEGDPLPYFHYTLTKDYLLLGERTRISIDNYSSLEEFDISYSNSEIISIDEYGSIYAIGEGETTVTISLKNYAQRFISFNFEVLQKRPTFVSNFTKMDLGDIATIYFKEYDDEMEQYAFSFQNGQILEATTDYKLRAIGYGDEIVTISLKSDPRVSSTLYVSVVNGDTNLLLYSENESGLMKARAQMQMTNSLNLSNLDLTWGTSDKNIAIVSEKGIVTGISEGYVSVYAKNNQTKEVINYYIKIEGIADVDYISRFIHLALDENGVHETDPTGTYPSSDNYQKYGEWYHNNGEPWCATFVSWCWHFSGLSTDLLCKYQGCTAGMKWCTEQGIMHYVQDFDFGDIEMENGVSPKQYAQTYTPISGDIVFFLSSGMSHTGIVIYADDTYVYTVEGNTSDQVAIKRWSLNDARITGYASPKYPEYTQQREDFSWIKEKKEDGTYWWKPVTLVEKVD